VDILTGAAKLWPTAQAHDATGPRGKNNVFSDHHYKPHDLAMATDTWRTPDTPGSGGPRNRQGSIGAGHQITIAEQAEHWQTPATDSVRSRGGDRKDEMGLDQQARMFPTPASRDYRTPNLKPGSERGMGTKGEHLQNFVEHQLPDWKREEMEQIGTHTCGECGTVYQGNMSTSCPTCQTFTSGTVTYPPSPPAPATLDGPLSSPQDLTLPQQWRSPTACSENSLRGAGQDSATRADQGHAVNLQDQVATFAQTKGTRRRLNPRFVEWLMGFPVGWSEL
jgi:hypothetical protein